MRQNVNLVKFFPSSSILLIRVDRRSFIAIISFWKKMMQLQKKKCLKCKREIHPMELHKLIMYVIEDEFTEHHYEHVECPERFTV